MNMLVVPEDISIKNAKLPAVYEAAKTALANCERIDECKKWADKAEALASYARQAGDDTLQKHARRIQSRAIGRAGELLKQFQTSAKGGRPKNAGGAPPVSQAAAGKKAGMSLDQQKQAIRVSNVPRDELDVLVESDNPPTVTKLAEMGKKPGKQYKTPDGFKEATAALGNVTRFADFCRKHDPAFVAGGVLKGEESKSTLEQASVIAEWLKAFTANIKG